MLQRHQQRVGIISPTCAHPRCAGGHFSCRMRALHSPWSLTMAHRNGPMAMNGVEFHDYRLWHFIINNRLN